MTKSIAILVLPALVLGLISCGGEEEPASPAPTGMEQPATPETPEMEPAPEAETETPAEEAPSMQDQAMELLDRLGKAVAGENWDAAKGLLGQLQGMKSQLSPELQKKIDDYAKQVAAQAGLAGSGIKLPGGG